MQGKRAGRGEGGGCKLHWLQDLLKITLCCLLGFFVLSSEVSSHLNQVTQVLLTHWTDMMCVDQCCVVWPKFILLKQSFVAQRCIWKCFCSVRWQMLRDVMACSVLTAASGSTPFISGWNDKHVHCLFLLCLVFTDSVWVMGKSDTRKVLAQVLWAVGNCTGHKRVNFVFWVSCHHQFSIRSGNRIWRLPLGVLSRDKVYTGFLVSFTVHFVHELCSCTGQLYFMLGRRRRKACLLLSGQGILRD